MSCMHVQIRNMCPSQVQSSRDREDEGKAANITAVPHAEDGTPQPRLHWSYQSCTG